MHESGEMYLETILVLKERHEAVRSIDVAAEMNVSKASVSRALGKLREEKCITVDENGHINFTDKGRSIAEEIYERHLVLSSLLVSLGVDEETATADACKIEHDISAKSFEAIKASLKRHGEYVKNIK